jgi:hypothetical protein
VDKPKVDVKELVEQKLQMGFEDIIAKDIPTRFNVRFILLFE